MRPRAVRFGVVSALIVSGVTPWATGHAATNSQSLVRSLYPDTLGRVADDTGLAFWSASLDNGTPRAQVALALELSPEGRGLVVQQEYQRLLGRGADAEGAAFWSQYLLTHTIEELEAAFISPPEYYATHGSGTDSGFVTAIYSDVLGRSVDAGGLAYDTSLLTGGTPRTQIASDLLWSLEARQHRVAGLYTSILHRGGDAGGVSYYGSQLLCCQTVQQVAASLYGSDEYLTLAFSRNPPTPTPSPVGPTPGPSPGPTGGGPLSADFFGPAFNNAPFCTFTHQNARVNGATLTTTYPAGSSAPSAGSPFGGAQVCLPFASGPATDATLSYDVRFPVGFEFVKGGKLPGVYGGVPPFSGGSHNPNGWSMRLMWRTGGAAEVYGYVSTTTGYGDDYGLGNFSFQADGQWHHLAEHVHLNSPGQADGWVTLSYDGQLFINETALPITATNTGITGLFFSTFYGGHDVTWAPATDQHIDFANFARS